MKCPYCKYEVPREREFEFAFIDRYDNPGSIKQKFSMGFGKYVEKMVSQFFHKIYECGYCGALFKAPDEHVIKGLKEEGIYKG